MPSFLLYSDIGLRKSNTLQKEDGQGYAPQEGLLLIASYKVDGLAKERKERKNVKSLSRV